MSAVGVPRLDACQFVLVAGETLVYGIYTVLFTRTVRALLARRRRNSGQGCKVLLCTAVFLFCCITVHWALDFSRAYDAFILAQDYIPRGPLEPNPATIFFLNVATPKYVAITVLYLVISSTLDCFMIYRLYIVWNKNVWIIILPILLEMGIIASGLFTSWLFSRAHSQSIFISAGNWILACFAINLILNSITTSLIGYKIWRRKRSLANLGVISSSSKIMQTVTQSAALYTVSAITTTVLEASHSNIQFINVGMNSPIMGIISPMVILSSRGSPTSSGVAFDSGSEHGSRRAINSHVIQMRPMAVKIDTEVERYGCPASKPDRLASRTYIGTSQLQQETKQSPIFEAV